MEPHIAVCAPPQIAPDILKRARTALAEYQGSHVVLNDSAYRLACLAAAHDHGLVDLAGLVECVTRPAFADTDTWSPAKVTSILAAEEFLDGYVGIRPVAIDAAYKLACLATGLGRDLSELVDGPMKSQVDGIINPSNINPLPPPKAEVLERFVSLALTVNYAIVVNVLTGLCMVAAKTFADVGFSWPTALLPIYGLPIHLLLAKMWHGGWRRFASLVSETGADTRTARKLERFRWFGGLCVIFGPALLILALVDILPLPWWAVFAVICYGPLLFGSSTAKQIRKHVALGSPSRAPVASR